MLNTKFIGLQSCKK